MDRQDCKNCYYPAPDPEKKKEAETAPAGAECPQCFYQPVDEPKEDTEECPQCFYQPEEKKKDQDGKTEECPQCFYQPDKE